MASLRALLIGFQPGLAQHLKQAGIDVVCRIGGGEGEPGTGFIEHHEIFKYKYFDPATPRTESAVRELVHEAIFGSFALCENRYANSRALLNDYQDHELLFDKALSQARTIIGKYKPDIVISGNVPHRGATLALFQYAHASGLRTAVCLQSQFPDRLFIVDHWSDLGIFSTSRRGEAAALPHDPPEQMPFYMNRLDGKGAKRRRAQIRYFGAAAQLIAAPVLGLTNSRSKRANRILDAMRSASQLIRYDRGRNAMPSMASSDIRGDFVYFPMHLQPEMTTDILGERWSNQVRALQRLREIVPPDIPLIIKENPKQTGLMRSTLFWEMLGSLPNTIFVEDEASSLELIRAARLTATITGTAGWEALRCERPALAFGHVFWRNLPGAFHIDDAPDWADIDAFRFDSTNFSDAVAAMSRHTYRGVADLHYSRIVSGFDPSANRNRLAASIAQHLAQVSPPA